MKKDFYFSRHYYRDKRIPVSLAIDCANTGKRELDAEEIKYKSRKKYKQGELIVIWKPRNGDVFAITAFWNIRRE